VIINLNKEVYMTKWKVVLLSMAIVVVYAVVAWVDDPADYEAPSTATYFTGVVSMRSIIPNVWSVTSIGCDDTQWPSCIEFLVEDSRLDFNQVVTIAIGAKPQYRKVPNGYVPEHIQVVAIEEN